MIIACSIAAPQCKDCGVIKRRRRDRLAGQGAGRSVVFAHGYNKARRSEAITDRRMRFRFVKASSVATLVTAATLVD